MKSKISLIFSLVLLFVISALTSVNSFAVNEVDSLLSLAESYTADTVKESDRDEIISLINKLLLLSETEGEDKLRIDGAVSDLSSCISRLDALSERLNGGKYEKYISSSVTADNLSLTHKSLLSDALSDAEDIISVYSGNLTDTAADAINNEIVEIKLFLETISKVEDAQSAIDALPDPDKTEPYDQIAINYLYRAELKCNLLSEAEKKMLDTGRMQALLAAVYKHEIITGGGAVKKEGSKGYLVFTTNLTPVDFTEVQINGEPLYSGHYYAEGKGSLILNESYLKTLKKGEYTLTLVYEDGVATASFTIADNGSGIWITLAIIIAVIGIFGVVMYVIITKKQLLQK